MLRRLRDSGIALIDPRQQRQAILRQHYVAHGFHTLLVDGVPAQRGCGGRVASSYSDCSVSLVEPLHCGMG